MNCFKSPFARKIEDEEMMGATFCQLKTLINEDAELAGLLFLLVIFSPDSLTLTKEETHQLKYFQKKSSFLLYEYLMSK